MKRYMKNYCKETGDVKGSDSYNKFYREEYNNVIKKHRNKVNKRKYKNDPLYSLKIKTRTMIYDALSNKTKRTEDILGCSFEDFKLYLESKFESWMNWGNRGLYNGYLNYGWDIDHIIPLSSVKTEEEIIKLNHYTNLQPLCSKINRDIKRNKLLIPYNPH
jgi:hypothetical protein